VPESNKQASLLNNIIKSISLCLPHREFKASFKFVEHLSLIHAAQQSVTISMAIIVTYLATPKAGAKHEFLLKTSSEVGFLKVKVGPKS
jgi:hypothetical protein